MLSIVNPLTSLLHFFNLKESINYLTYYVYGKTRSYVQPYISTQFSVDQIINNVYIGDFASACNKQELLKLGITHIVTVIVGVDAMYPESFKYLTVSVCDQQQADIYKYFDDCSDFIHEAITNGGMVYVHCMCGISRSATIIAAYLINKHQYNDVAAIEKIRECRQCINPNEGFKQQLALYYEYIKKKHNSQNL